MQMKNLLTIIDIISLLFTVFPCKFFLPQIKWNLIPSKIRKLGNEKKITKLGETQASVQSPL